MRCCGWAVEKAEMTHDPVYLAELYRHAQHLLKGAPEMASARKKRKARRIIRRQNKAWEQASGFSDASDEAFFRVLREAYEQVERNTADQEEALADFPPNVRNAFTELLECHYDPTNFVWEGAELSFRFNNWGLPRTLQLHDAEGSFGDWQLGDPPFWRAFLRRKDGRYCLYGKWSETEAPFEVIFSDANLQTICIDYTARQIPVFQAPWQLLHSAAMALLQKAEATDVSLNQEEEALLPLATEIAELLWKEPYSCPLLRELAASYGLPRVEKLLAALEESDCKHRQRKVHQLISLFCKQNCEPLWRDIYGRFRASQKDYPFWTDLECPPDVLSRMRDRIQTLMKARGYEGTYPDFFKIGKLTGFRIVRSPDGVRFIGRAKRTVFRVSCVESAQETGCVNIQFVSGTAFLKEGETADDIYACLFRAKGRRLFRTNSVCIPFEGAKPRDLALNVRIAAKRAELQKLTAEEMHCIGKIHSVSMILLGICLFLICVGIAFLRFGKLSIALIVVAIVAFLVYRN